MSDNYVFGRSRERLIGDTPQYVYGLRRTDEGELYFVRVNQLSRTDSFEINRVGEQTENFNDFEPGVDVGRAQVLVVQVVGVLPHVEH